MRSYRLAAVVLFSAAMALAQPLNSIAGESLQVAAGTSAGPDAAAPKAAGRSRTAAEPKAPAARTKTVRKRPQKSVSPAVPERAASVYLMRGFLGIFSLGMDRLNSSLRAQGVKTRILGHTGWPSVVDEIAAEAALHPKNRAPIVIIGHSLGGNAALQAAYVLGKRGIPVDLVVTVDPTSSHPISSVVKRYLNIYISNDGLGSALAASGSGVDNDNIRNNPELDRPGVNHFTMDENPIVQKQILAAVLKVLGRKDRGG